MTQINDTVGLERFRYGIARRLRECCPDTAQGMTRGGQR
jgi:hypothetical protein